MSGKEGAETFCLLIFLWALNKISEGRGDSLSQLLIRLRSSSIVEQSQNRWSDCSRRDVVWPQRSTAGTENTVISQGEEDWGRLWQCESAAQPSSELRSGWCYLSLCVWGNQPGPRQHEPWCPLLETSNYLGLEDVWVGCGILWEVTSHHRLLGRSWRGNPKRGPSLTDALGFSAKWLLFPPEFWMWQQFKLFSHFSAVPLSVTSEW